MSIFGSNFRLYTFINFYLSSIQQGIQTAHIVSELLLKYKNVNDDNINYCAVVNQWAQRDKTIIVLNGGTSFDLRQDYINISHITEMLTKRDSWTKWYLPHAFFTEDFNALGVNNHGLITGFGIILPEEIWGAEEIPKHNFNPWVDPIGMTTANLNEQIPQYNFNQNNKVCSFYYGEPDSEIISFLKSKSLAR